MAAQRRGEQRTYGVRLWDGTWDLTANLVEGVPAWRWRMAPAGLLTRRQLRADGLAPGGHDPVGLVYCRRGRRRAYLYRRDLAIPKRTPTLAQRAAIAAMQRARRRCPTCGEVQEYVIPWRALGECIDCYEHNYGELPNAA